MPKTSPEKLAAALRANLKRRKAVCRPHPPTARRTATPARPPNLRKSPRKTGVSPAFPWLFLGWGPGYNRYGLMQRSVRPLIRPLGPILDKTMDRIRIRGGRPLKGEIPISGAKNAALKLMAASLLTAEPLTLANVPRLADVRAMAELLVSFGVGVQVTMAAQFGEGDTMKLEAREITSVFATYDMVRKMRASFQVLAPLLARQGRPRSRCPAAAPSARARSSCTSTALEAMGAKIELAEGYVTATAPDGLKGAEIVFPFVSVGATETAMMAATLAKGTTKIVNAAREPEISDLGQCLIAMGAKISGLGSSRDHRGRRDRASWRPASGDARPHRGRHLCHRRRHRRRRGRAGGRFARNHRLAAVAADQKRRRDHATTRAGLKIHMNGARPHACDVTTAPYPGFPTDLQAQIMALMAVADGTSVIREKIFENRFMHVPELARMGAQVRIDGDTATVRGVEKLKGAPVMATDLRASVSLVLAGLAAEGETMVSRVYHLDRGFDRLEEKLSRVGADIARVSE